MIAGRMAATLTEVLGGERAQGMYSHDELVERVLWHLDDVEGRRSAVFVSVDGDGEITGHTIVRAEPEEGPGVGLFSTTYVDPARRRERIASGLLQRGEKWMRDRGLRTAVTYTDSANTKLIELYRSHGYTIEFVAAEWARASKEL